MHIKKLHLPGNFSLITKLFYVLLAIPAIQINLGFNITASAIIGILSCAYFMLRRSYHIDMYMLTTFFLFLIGEGLSLLICPDVSRSLNASGLKIIVILVLYPYLRSTIKNEQDCMDAMRLFTIGAMITCFIVFLKTVLNIDIGMVKLEFRTGRIDFGGYGANVMARLFCIAGLFSLYEAQISTGARRFACYLKTILLIYGLMTTISISGIAIFALGAIVIYAQYNEGVRRYGVFKFLLIILFIVSIGVVIYYHNTVIHRLVDNIVYRNSLDTENIMHGRFNGFNELFLHINDYLLIGIGYACSNYVVGKTIHIPIVASLVETGIFGFISCWILYWRPFKKAVIQMRKERVFLCIPFIGVLILLGDMIQPNPNYLFTWFAIFAGGFVFGKKGAEGERKMME